MLYKDGKFRPAGFPESFKLACTFLSAAAQIGLDIALSVLIGSERSFRAHSPWALLLAVALAASWTFSLLLLFSSLLRLVRFLNNNHSTLKERSNLVLPLGAESLAAALGSAFLSAAVVWVAKTVRDTPIDAQRYTQFDIYFPIAIGFQILALPGFVRLADIFAYAESKAKRELETAETRSQYKKKTDLQSVSTGGTAGSLISAESIKAAQKELDLARARLERRERNLASVSTGGSAQTIAPQKAFTRPLVPMVERPQRSDREDRRGYARQAREGRAYRQQQDPEAAEGVGPVQQLDRGEQPDTRIDIFSSAPTKKSWFG